VRSRKDGAAVPLDETDKQLLNLMQGSFPLDPRPFAAIAGLAGLAEEEVLGRVAYLLDKRYHLLALDEDREEREVEQAIAERVGAVGAS